MYVIVQSAGAVSPNECPGYDTKQSDGEISVMLEHWKMRSAPLLPSLPIPFWLGVVVPDHIYKPLRSGRI